MSYIGIVRYFRRPFDYICHDGQDKYSEAVARFCVWLQSGTNCECCKGMRILAAFLGGLVLGAWL